MHCCALLAQSVSARRRPAAFEPPLGRLPLPRSARHLCFGGSSAGRGVPHKSGGSPGPSNVGTLPRGGRGARLPRAGLALTQPACGRRGMRGLRGLHGLRGSSKVAPPGPNQHSVPTGTSASIRGQVPPHARPLGSRGNGAACGPFKCLVETGCARVELYYLSVAATRHRYCEDVPLVASRGGYG